MLYKKHVLVAMALLFLIFFYSISLPLFFFYTPSRPAIPRSLIYTHTLIHSHTRAHTQLPTLPTSPRSLSLNFITRRLVNIYIRGRMSASGAWRGLTRGYGSDGEKKEAERTVVGALKQKPETATAGVSEKTTSSALRTIDFCIFLKFN